MRQKQPKRLKKTNWPRRQLRQVRREAEEECAVQKKKAAELVRKPGGASGKRRSSTSNQDGQEQRSPLKLRRKMKRASRMHCVLCKNFAL